MGRIQVGDQRKRGRSGRRFADGHQHSRNGQRQEAARQPARHGGHGPEQAGHGQQADTRHAVHQPPGRQAHEGIDGRERQARDQADGRVADTEFGLDRFDHDREYLAPDEVIGKHHGQQQ
ncbi:hypothetical protein D3C84_846280 [compost metagenome]